MITFLKLGGSLITDKNKAHHAREDVIRRLAAETLNGLRHNPQERLILGHGSGSFGHFPAKKFGTRDGVRSRTEWEGFAEVHYEASSLNQIVTDIYRRHDLPCLTFTPLSSVCAREGKIKSWEISPIRTALENGLIPVVYGDTVFDTDQGGTILSTEDLFVALAAQIGEPSRLLLAGLEEGIWEDFPQRTKLIRRLDVSTLRETETAYIRESVFTDVTGGMREKVRLAAGLISGGIIQSAAIFSGEVPGNLEKALAGENPGTLLVSGN